MKLACLATCEDSQTITIGVARTWAWRKTRPSHALSKDRKLGGSSRSPRWAGSIIGTNVAPLERTDGVESQQQTTLLRFLGRAVSFLRRRPSRSRRHKLTTTLVR